MHYEVEMYAFFLQLRMLHLWCSVDLMRVNNTMNMHLRMHVFVPGEQDYNPNSFSEESH